MDEQTLDQHLSQLSTCWELLAQAHGGMVDEASRARAALIQRYQNAVYRYLLKALQSKDGADEVFQEFALKVLRGDFRRVDSARGRFRDYVKTVLIHLIIRYRTQQGRRFAAAQELPPDEVIPDQSTPEEDNAFLEGWRDELLRLTWERLAARQREDGPPFHDALLLLAENPDLTAAVLAERLNQRLRSQRSYTEAGIRKVVQRARELFADLLLDEVARSLGGGSREEVEEELIDLKLHRYCRKALERRRK